VPRDGHIDLDLRLPRGRQLLGPRRVGPLSVSVSGVLIPASESGGRERWSGGVWPLPTVSVAVRRFPLTGSVRNQSKIEPPASETPPTSSDSPLTADLVESVLPG
jgi:hypothetical protein